MLSTLLCMNGKCREAVEFYRQAFDAEVHVVLPNRDNDHLIDHAEIIVHGQLLMLNDFGYNDRELPSNGYMLSVRFDTEVALKRVFSLMREGCKILSPMSQRDYTPCQINFVDRFDVRWGFWV